MAGAGRWASQMGVGEEGTRKTFAQVEEGGGGEGCAERWECEASGSVSRREIEGEVGLE